MGSFKPEPGLFLAAAERLGLPPQHCAAVEDSAPGFRAAVAAGMATFAVGEAAEAVPPELRDRVTRLARLEDLAEQVGLAG